MSSQPPNRKSPFVIFQSIFTLLTPVFVAVFGTIINLNVNKTEAKINEMKAEMDMLRTEQDLQINPVEAMEPFMIMLSHPTDITKNIMGAYGIYMLKKGQDSRIAAQMIAASQKEHLEDVLRTIGKDDDSVQKYLDELGENAQGISALEFTSFSENSEEIKELSDMQKYALKVRATIEQTKIGERDNQTTNTLTGWIYLGNKNTGLIIKSYIEGDNNKTYELLSGTNLRKDRPDPNTFKLAQKIKALSKGTSVKIIESNPDKKGHVWAQIAVQEK